MQTKSIYSLAACSHFVFTSFPYENLGERGFHLDQGLNHESHGVIVQTLLAQSPEAGAVRLEFRDIVDEEEFLDSSRRHNPSARGREVLRPSLHFFGDASMQLNVGSIPVTVLPKPADSLEASSHPNSVSHLWGLYLGLSAKGIEEWNQFLGTPAVEHQWLLQDGVRIVAAQPGDGLYEFMEIRKDFPFWAVILKCQSFQEFERQADPERVFQWQGRPTALIKEHLTDWDLLVI